MVANSNQLDNKKGNLGSRCRGWLRAGPARGDRGAQVTNAEILEANWRPVAPFRDRWDDKPIDEPIEDVIPVGVYPVKRLKVARIRK